MLSLKTKYYRCSIIFNNYPPLNLFLQESNEELLKIKVKALVDSLLIKNNCNYTYCIEISESSEEEQKIFGSVSFDKSMSIN